MGTNENEWENEEVTWDVTLSVEGGVCLTVRVAKERVPWSENAK